MDLNQALKENFYTTQHNAALLSSTTRMPLKSEGKCYTIKNKNIGITNKKPNNNKQYMVVLKEDNYQTKNPSFIEYPIFYKKTYEEAKKNYKRSFTDALKQGKKYKHEINIYENLTNDKLKEIYTLYKKQMKEHNTFFFPKKYFEELLKLKEGKAFTIKHQQKLIAYCLFFENKENIYTSMGGSIKKQFIYKPTNKLYDEIIKYACHNNKNIHFGLGEHNSNYSRFKQKVGCIIHKTEKRPNDEKILKLLVPLTKYKLTGLILAAISRLFPRKVVYLHIPFT